jgi:hypothetical protein
VSVVEPLRDVSVRQAKAYLDHMLPALASLTETLLGTERSYYIGVTATAGSSFISRPLKRGPRPRARRSSRSRLKAPPVGDVHERGTIVYPAAAGLRRAAP